MVSHLFSLLADLSKNSGVNQIMNEEHEHLYCNDDYIDDHDDDDDVRMMRVMVVVVAMLLLIKMTM